MAWDRREFLVFLTVGILFRISYLLGDVYQPLFPIFGPCQSNSYQGGSGGSVAGNDFQSEDVVALNEPNIQSFIDNHSQWVFIMFHIPSCPHSVTAQSEFAIAAKQLKNEKGDSIVFASVNCDNNKKTCKDQKIDGFPTLYLFYNGKFVEEYRKERLSSNFIDYGRNPTKPSWFSGWF